MDIENWPVMEPAAEVAPESVGATLLATSALGQEPPAAESLEQPHPASTSPSGWTLVVASVAIAVAVLLILGIGFGVGYLIDRRNGVDTLGVEPASTQCVTNT